MSASPSWIGRNYAHGDAGLPLTPPRSPRVSSPQVTATEVGNRWSSNLRTPRATIEEENADGSAEVDDLLPDREGVDLPTDTFNDGGGPTEAEVQEFAGDVEMEPEKEAEPASGHYDYDRAVGGIACGEASGVAR